MPQKRPAALASTVPGRTRRVYEPLQPTDLTCTCTTYVTDNVEWTQRCIYCQLKTVFGPSPSPTPRTSSLPMAARRRNMRKLDPHQGRMI